MRDYLVHIIGPLDEETGLPMWEFWEREEA